MDIDIERELDQKPTGNVWGYFSGGGRRVGDNAGGQKEGGVGKHVNK